MLGQSSDNQELELLVTDFDDVFTEEYPSVFFVEPMLLGLVDGKYVQFSAADSTTDRMSAGGGSATVFLDGGVITREVVDPQMFAEDSLGDGIWVIGRNAVRLVCDAAGIGQPGWASDSEPSLESLRIDVAERKVATGDPSAQLKLLSMCETPGDIAELAARVREHGRRAE